MWTKRSIDGAEMRNTDEKYGNYRWGTWGSELWSGSFKPLPNGSVMNFVRVVWARIWAWGVLLLTGPLRWLPRLCPLLCWHGVTIKVLWFYQRSVCSLDGEPLQITHLSFTLQSLSFRPTPVPFKHLGDVSGISYKIHTLQEWGSFKKKTRIWISSFRKISL